jgi:hypothetical protein
MYRRLLVNFGGADPPVAGVPSMSDTCTCIYFVPKFVALCHLQLRVVQLMGHAANGNPITKFIFAYFPLSFGFANLHTS